MRAPFTFYRIYAHKMKYKFAARKSAQKRLQLTNPHKRLLHCMSLAVFCDLVQLASEKMEFNLLCASSSHRTLSAKSTNVALLE